MQSQKLHVVDLFAGVGGLSLGAARAGFNVVAAVDLDERANAQHAKNFPRTKHLSEDVAVLSGEKLLRTISVTQSDLYGVIGGPPCQGFSEIGLRGAEDPRNDLFLHFFRLVGSLRPVFYLAENVPGVTHERNRSVRERALAMVPKDYVALPPMLIKASDFGAPTSRARVFFFGYDPARINRLTQEDFRPRHPDDVRVARALAGLPAIRATWQSETQSWRSVARLPTGSYEERTSSMIPEGVGDREALQAYTQRAKVSGFLGTVHEAATKKRFAALRPGAVDSVSKSVRLRMDGYCPTLRAGTGPERGSYQAIRPIHPSSPRVIAPREAARLQGFPDWFQFHPTKWHAFRQIGNSVSPIVAEALLLAVRKAV
jgi:DNA (cytosine-5)-methyltransferase 1